MHFLLCHIAFRSVRNYLFKSSKGPDRQVDTTESQVDGATGVKKKKKTVLPENLPQDGGLVRIITVWPTLSDELKNAIVKMIS